MDQRIVVALIGLGIMLVLLAMGTNIGITFGVVGFLGFWYVRQDFNAAFGMFRSLPFNFALNYNQSVLIMFTLMGQIAFQAGLSQGLYDAADKWLCKFRGGLCMATITACAGFASICGSSTATSATMGTVALPEMKKYGYADSLAAGCVAAGGTLGILIPPSNIFIIYGLLVEESIGRLFAAGVFPGILLTLCYIACVAVVVKINPSLVKAPYSATWEERFKSLKGLVGVVVLFVVVIGGMFGGWFTANEAAAAGVFVATIIMWLNKRLTWANYVSALKNGMKTVGMVMLTLVGCTMFGNFLSITQLPVRLAAAVGGMEVSRFVVIGVLLVFYIIMGCIMDSLPLCVLTVPIFLPLIHTLGFSTIWYGVFMVMVCQMGTITPPVGINIFVVAGVAKSVPLETVFKGVLPFTLALLVAVLFVIFVPGLATWLPSVLYVR